MAREKYCVGIDIGASSVKLCQLKRVKRGLVLDSFGHVPLPAETIVEGVLMNSLRVVEAIQELIASHRVRNKNVAIAVSGTSVIIKKISLPLMTAEELEKSIEWEAAQFIQFDMQDVYLDAEILNDRTAQQGQMDVVLVAAKKDFVNDYTAVVREAGLEPAICDVDAFAVENMFLANYDLEPGETVVLVNVGASKTNVNIVTNGASSFTRDLNMGGNNFTAEIKTQLNVSYDEAEALKLGGGNRGGQSDAVVPHEVQRALNAVAESVANEISRSIDFYSATSASPSPSRLYVTGGSARLQVLTDLLSDRINVPVEVADPFRRIDISSHDATYLRSLAPGASVAVGLALRYLGEGG